LFLETAWALEVRPPAARWNAWEEERAAIRARWAEAGPEKVGEGRAWRREGLYERGGTVTAS